MASKIAVEITQSFEPGERVRSSLAKGDDVATLCGIHDALLHWLPQHSEPQCTNATLSSLTSLGSYFSQLGRQIEIVRKCSRVFGERGMSENESRPVFKEIGLLLFRLSGIGVIVWRETFGSTRAPDGLFGDIDRLRVLLSSIGIRCTELNERIRLLGYAVEGGSLDDPCLLEVKELSPRYKLMAVHTLMRLKTICSQATRNFADELPLFSQADICFLKSVSWESSALGSSPIYPGRNDSRPLSRVSEAQSVTWEDVEKWGAFFWKVASSFSKEASLFRTAGHELVDAFQWFVRDVQSVLKDSADYISGELITRAPHRVYELGTRLQLMETCQGLRSELQKLDDGALSSSDMPERFGKMWRQLMSIVEYCYEHWLCGSMFEGYKNFMSMYHSVFEDRHALCIQHTIAEAISGLDWPEDERFMIGYSSLYDPERRCQQLRVNEALEILTEDFLRMSDRALAPRLLMTPRVAYFEDCLNDLGDLTHERI